MLRPQRRRSAILAFLLGFTAPLWSALSKSSPSGEEVYRLNCGADGWDLTDYQGNWWVKDEPFTGLWRWGYIGGQATDVELAVSTAVTPLPEVYRTNRWGGTDMKYRIEVPNGRYDVTLHFAETYWSSPGQRIFDVALNGRTVLPRLDPFTRAGGKFRPFAATFPVTVTNEFIEVTFPRIDVDNALISGIEAKVASVSNDDLIAFQEKKMFWYFWNEADPGTGLVPDRARSFESASSRHASVATTGWALSVLTIGAERGWITRAEAADRVLTTLQSFDTRLFNKDGFWYHFVDKTTGARWVFPENPGGKIEVSTVDSAIFILGALQAGEYFRADRPDIAALADKLYRRMNWQSYVQSPPFISMGWTPEDGYLPARWDMYAESVFVNLLAFGSPTHAVSTAAWTQMRREWSTNFGLDHMYFSRVFGHQYHHNYFDFKNVHDDFANYWDNTRKGTLVNKRLAEGDGDHEPDVWGLSACDGPGDTYQVFGDAPWNDINGTVCLAAAPTSIEFTPTESITAARKMYFQYKHWVWGRNGFTDGMNVPQNFASRDTLGLDNGALVLAYENFRTGLIRRTFMQNPHVRAGMARAGFRGYEVDPVAFPSSVKNGNDARFAVDASTDTRWESQWADDQRLTVDYGAPRPFQSARLLWETAHGKDYRIQVSNDGESWSTAATVTGGDGWEDQVGFAPLRARFVRMQGDVRGGAGGNVWGFSLHDFRPRSLFGATGPAAADGTVRSAADAAGRLHVTFYDPVGQGLRYALWNGDAWTTDESVDATAGGYAADDGSHTFLVTQDVAVGADGEPRVIYYSTDGVLRFARRSNGVWSKETIASVDYSVTASLTLGPDGEPHVAYSAPIEGGTLRYGRRRNGVWTLETVSGASTANTNRLATAPNGDVHLVYGTNSEPHELHYLKRTAAGWGPVEVADDVPEEGWRYRVNPTLLLDGEGRPRVMDCLNNRNTLVRYSVRSDAGWTSEYAHRDAPDWDHTGTPDPVFLLDGDGRPRALYVVHRNYDPFRSEVILARRDGDVWTETVLAETTRWNPGSSLVLDAQGRALILYPDDVGRLQLLRVDDAGAPPVGGGRNGLVQSPTGLTGTPLSGGITWTWTDHSANEAGFRLYGATTAAGPYVRIADLPAGTTQFAESGLTAGVAVHRFVTARNGGGEASSLMASAVPGGPAAPTLLTVAARTTTSLTWSWKDNAANETGFRVLRASDGAVLSSTLPANTTRWTQTGLGVNQGQSVIVEAYHAGGARQSAPSPTFYTLTNPPRNTRLTLQNGVRRLAWDANGNPAGTKFRAQKSTDRIVYNTIQLATTTASGTGALAAQVTYYFRVRAENGNGIASAFDVVVATRLPTGAWVAAREDAAFAEFPDPRASVGLFAGPWPEGATVSVETRDDVPEPSAWPIPWSSAGPAVGLRLEETSVSGPFIVTLPKPEGLMGRATLARYDEITGLWSILPAEASGDARSVVARSPDLAVYRVLGAAPAANVDKPSVFPNPFRPARGHVGVTIANLPADARVTLTTGSGERVRELRSDADGTVLWDGDNASGRPVASGVYIGLAEGSGGRKTFRLAVER